MIAQGAATPPAESYSQLIVRIEKIEWTNLPTPGKIQRVGQIRDQSEQFVKLERGSEE
jgi:hypothetical protein